jgi:hypothetical protein
MPAAAGGHVRRMTPPGSVIPRATPTATDTARIITEPRAVSQSFHQPLLRPTGAHLPDDPSDVSCKESTRQYCVDGPLLSCNLLLVAWGPRSCRCAFKFLAGGPARATSGLPAWLQVLQRRCLPRERSSQRESDGAVSWLRRRPPRSRAASPDWLRISRSRSRSGRRATIAVIRASTPTR